MKKAKEILLCLLRPHIAVTMLLAILSTLALVYVFMSGMDESLLSIPVYVLSAYTLTTIAFRIPNVVRKIKAFIYGNKYSHRYVTDFKLRTQISLYSSLAINLTYSVFQIIAGIIYASVWSIAVAVYYIVVCGVRFLLLHHFRKEKGDDIEELKAYCFCGALLFALNVAMSGMIIQMVRDGKRVQYPGLLIYAMAAYAFYRVIISIINMIKHRKLHSPILSASKMLGFATALMAIFSLETAMLTEFGGEGTELFQRIMLTATGGGVALIVFGMAVCMIIRANKELRKLQINNS